MAGAIGAWLAPRVKSLIIRQIEEMSALAANSRRMRPSPLNHSSSSLSRSNVPAVSTENAWILENGRLVKSFFFPVSPWTLIVMMRLFVKTTPSRIPLNVATMYSPLTNMGVMIGENASGSAGLSLS